MSISHLIKKRPITWDYIKRINNWTEEQFNLALAEAEHNGFSPAMFLPLDEYISVQHENIEIDIRSLNIYRVK